MGKPANDDAQTLPSVLPNMRYFCLYPDTAPTPAVLRTCAAAHACSHHGGPKAVGPPLLSPHACVLNAANLSFHDNVTTAVLLEPHHHQ